MRTWRDCCARAGKPRGPADGGVDLLAPPFASRQKVEKTEPAEGLSIKNGEPGNIKVDSRKMLVLKNKNSRKVSSV